MKKTRNLQILLALFLTGAAPLASMADTLLYTFDDDFTNGSTINFLTPASPTTTNTSYETISSKTWDPNPPYISGQDLKFGIGATSVGTVEIQALFATNAVALTEPGDNIQMTIVFTNTSGLLLTGSGFLGFGLYNSGQVLPVAGGLNGNATASITTDATGGAQNWQGYVGQIAYPGQKSQIMTRAAQTGTGNNNQDLVTSGSSSESYKNPAATTVGSSTIPSVTLAAGATYTEVLNITLNGTSSLAITNFLYSGPDTNGTLLTQFGGVATNATYLTGGFDAFAVGWNQKTSGPSNCVDISSVVISSQSTVITTPPTITSQPVPVSVATNGSCAFSVSAVGFDVTYQWRRNGTNLPDGGNISGATTAQLVISPAGTNDALSSANGYDVVVSGAGGYSTNSVTNSLTLVAATNLIWTDSNPNNVWDLDNTVNWQDTNGNQTVFNYGDPVTFNDTGAGGAVVLTGQYLSAASVTVNSSYFYNFSGSGSFAGPGNLIYDGPVQFTIGNANAYTGGTIISNATAYLLLQNYNGLGTGPVTLAKAGGTMEIAQAGSASLGVPGDIVVADDFPIQVDGNGSYAAVFLGNLSGAAGKTLTLVPTAVNNTTNDRIRVYGGTTTNSANLFLNSPLITFAPYNSSGSQTYNGVISGTGSVMQKGTTTYLNGANTYSGGTFPVSAAIGLGGDSTGNPVTSGPIGTGPLLLTVDSTTTLTGDGMIFAAGGPHTIANPIQYPTGTNNLTLVIGGTNDLTLSGAFTLNGNDLIVTNTFTARTVQVTNTALTTLSGVISDLTNGVSAGYGFIKTGSGVLALNNAETYTGPTTVSNGTLQVNGQLNAASAVTVSTNATLAGTGTINGPVTVAAGGPLAPGGPCVDPLLPNTLTINNRLTLSGNVQVQVSTQNGLHSDNAVVSGALTNASTGTVTVLGAALQPGDTFTLFNKPLTNGAALTVTGAGMNWANNLAVNGTIAVLGPAVLVPTNSAHITGFSLVNANVVINGTNGESGGAYYLLASTNVALPLSQWTAVATNIINTNGASGAFTFTGTNVVTPNDAQLFYILSNTNN